MRTCVTFLCILLVPALASAFDSRAWLARRARMENDARKLRAVYSNCVERLRSPAENLTVPIEHFPDGSVKATISARRAQVFLDSDYVWGEGVVVREYDADGKVELTLSAESCVVDRARKCGWAEGAAKASAHGQATVEGVGIYFSFSEEFVKIFSNAEIRFENVKLKGVKL